VVTLDLHGEVCPYTFVKTKLALEQLAPGALLRIVIDHAPASRNIPRACREDGHEVVSVEPAGPAEWLIIVRKGCPRSTDLDGPFYNEKMAHPPPLPGKPRPSGQRKFERVEIIAQVQCKAGDEVYILRATNASPGGLFLEGKPSLVPLLRPGVEVELGLLPDQSLDAEPIEIRARVVRMEEGKGGMRAGFGVVITKVDPRTKDRFDRLLKSAK